MRKGTEHAAELPEGILSCDQVTEDNVVVYSLTAHALHAIERAIAPSKLDAPESNDAIERWLQNNWRGWVRSKLLEHLLGWRCWGAFGEDHYALFRRQSVNNMADAETIQTIALKLADGGENLDIINWAVAEGKDMDSILYLLDRVDINTKRHRLLTDHIRLFLENDQGQNDE